MPRLVRLNADLSKPEVTLESNPWRAVPLTRRGVEMHCLRKESIPVIQGSKPVHPYPGPVRQRQARVRHIVHSAFGIMRRMSGLFTGFLSVSSI